MATVLRNPSQTTCTEVEIGSTKSSAASLSVEPCDKTILFVTKTGEYGGAEKHLLELIRRLVGPGVRISILCLDKDLYSEHLKQFESAHIAIISSPREVKSFLDWYRVFRGASVDVVVFVRAWLWCYPWYAPIAAWLAGISRRISIAHLTPPPLPKKPQGGSIVSVVSRVRRRLYLLALKLSALSEHAIICVSNAIRDALTVDYHFPVSRTVRIYNGVNLLDFRECQDSGLRVRRKLGLSAQEFLLVCAARLNEQKRVDILLLAMNQLVRDGVNCKCVIIGDGPLKEELMRRTSALNLSGHVFFEG